MQSDKNIYRGLRAVIPPKTGILGSAVRDLFAHWNIYTLFDECTAPGTLVASPLAGFTPALACSLAVSETHPSVRGSRWLRRDHLGVAPLLLRSSDGARRTLDGAGRSRVFNHTWVAGFREICP